ncbi:hypothetical protein E5676_scaffold499G00710 [Cucumis melo var. makuwa]|uniref:Uncharacterized protein n=1 Tax=Cucumis melo var. makuwa TaxID=1194695 RepID=A0A5D3CE54_CUCMM|nr:hypothetical protein E5676_scaffold499G00710 [Cucumis melo var. makuwa]
MRGISSVGARALQPLPRDLVAWKAYCLAVRTRQVNLQLLWLYDGCRDGECDDDLSVMLYADAMCVPRGTEDQSYVPTGAHVARVRERARDWIEDEARAKASWRTTRSDRGEP